MEKYLFTVNFKFIITFIYRKNKQKQAKLKYSNTSI